MHVWSSITSFLAFDSKAPFIFTAVNFWIFFALVLIVDAFVHRNRLLRHSFLFIASIFFYYKTTGLFFLLLLFTAVWDFLVGKKIASTENAIAKKRWLAVSVCMNLAVLFYFKYAYFFTDIYNSMTGSTGSVFNVLA